MSSSIWKINMSRRRMPFLPTSLAMCAFIACTAIVLRSPRIIAAEGNSSGENMHILDDREFALDWGPKEVGTPGILTYGGYHWRNVTVTEEEYDCTEDDLVRSDVQIVHHPEGYHHVLHDFFGTFRVSALDAKVPKTNRAAVNGVVDEGPRTWQFVDWADENGKQQKICYTFVPKSDGIHGFAGWYSIKDGRITTVMVRFSRVKGIPVQVVNKYLAQYPSSVAIEDYHGERWVEEDLRKYIDLIRTQQADGGLFRMALDRLQRFDREGFGYRELFKGQMTREQTAEAAEILIGRMEQALSKLKEKRGAEGE